MEYLNRNLNLVKVFHGFSNLTLKTKAGFIPRINEWIWHLCSAQESWNDVGDDSNLTALSMRRSSLFCSVSIHCHKSPNWLFSKM